MVNIKIRQYTDSDLEQCQTLWKELTQHHRDIYSDPSIGGDDPGHYFDEHLARVGPERLWVADDSGRVIGLIGLIVEDEEAEVEPLVVTPKNRNKGIGHALLFHVIEEAKKLGVRYLNVRPVARNVKAVTFFYESGFSILGHINLFMDLKEEKNKWVSGPELFGCSFQY
jgi:N-acetylglutamate synthase-like GNAT family acetyltransferase